GPDRGRQWFRPESPPFDRRTPGSWNRRARAQAGLALLHGCLGCPGAPSDEAQPFGRLRATRLRWLESLQACAACCRVRIAQPAAQVEAFSEIAPSAHAHRADLRKAYSADRIERY